MPAGVVFDVVLVCEAAQEVVVAVVCFTLRPPGNVHCVVGVFVHDRAPVTMFLTHRTTTPGPTYVGVAGGGHVAGEQKLYGKGAGADPGVCVTVPGTCVECCVSLGVTKVVGGVPGWLALVPVPVPMAVRPRPGTPGDTAGPVVPVVPDPGLLAPGADPDVPGFVAPAGAAASTRVPTRTASTASQRTSVPHPDHRAQRDACMEPSLAGCAPMPSLSAARGSGAYPSFWPGPQKASFRATVVAVLKCVGMVAGYFGAALGAALQLAW